MSLTPNRLALLTQEAGVVEARQGAGPPAEARRGADPPAVVQLEVAPLVAAQPPKDKCAGASYGTRQRSLLPLVVYMVFKSLVQLTRLIVLGKANRPNRQLSM